METFSIAQVAVNILLLLLTSVPIIVFKTAIDPFQRGYFCSDESIRYPYKDSTVDLTVLLVTGTVIPVSFIFIFEVIRLHLEGKRVSPKDVPEYSIGSHNIHRLPVRLYIFIGYYIFGMLLTATLTSMGKYSMGRLRPHFLSVCFKTLPACNNNNYIQPITCDVSESVLEESRLSFPSGHASFSFYSMLYLVLYLEARVFWTMYSPLVKPLIQFFMITLAIACSLSRISDYQHHWSDVLAGSLLGIVVSIIVGKYVAKLLERREVLFDPDAPSVVREEAVFLHLKDVQRMREGQPCPPGLPPKKGYRGGPGQPPNRAPFNI